MNSATSDAGSETPRRKPKSDRPRNPDIKRLVDHYHAEFVRTQGRKPVIRGAISAKAASLLLSGRSLDGPEGAAWIVTRFLEDPPPWNRERCLLRLEDIPGAATSVLTREGPGRPASTNELLVREQVQHGNSELWPDYEQAVMAGNTDVGFSEFARMRAEASP